MQCTLVRFSPGGESHSDPRERGFRGYPGEFRKNSPGISTGIFNSPPRQTPGNRVSRGIPFKIPGEYSLNLGQFNGFCTTRVLRGTYYSSMPISKNKVRRSMKTSERLLKTRPIVVRGGRTGLDTIAHLSNVVVSADRRDGRSTGGRSA